MQDEQMPASMWSWFQGAAEAAGYVLAATILALLVAAIVVLLLLQVQTRSRRLRDHWPAKDIRRPTLEVMALQDGALRTPLGAAIAGLIRGCVTWKRDRFGLNVVSGQAGVASALSGLGDVSDQAKAAAAVINFLTALLPRQRFVLSGELQPAGAQGAGISLELSQEGGAKALITFWAASFDLPHGEAPEIYQHLAVASASWVDIWMAKSVGSDGDDLLTRDPESWAYFRCGVDRQRLGHLDAAEGLYEQALAKDGTNVGALANLGIICRRARRYEEAERYLERASNAIEGP